MPLDKNPPPRLFVPSVETVSRAVLYKVVQQRLRERSERGGTPGRRSKDRAVPPSCCEAVTFWTGAGPWDGKEVPGLRLRRRLSTATQHEPLSRGCQRRCMKTAEAQKALSRSPGGEGQLG